jgi:hypothetical protein
VTRVVLAQRAHLCGALAEQGIDATSVVVADDENLELADEYGFHRVEQNNDLLGRKFNDGIEYALRELHADHIVLIGSDDWVHPDVFAVLPAAETHMELPTPEQPAVIYRPRAEMTAGTRIALVDLPTGRMRLCHHNGRLGVIPWVIPRQAFGSPRPLLDDQGKGIDGALYRGLKNRPKVVLHDPSAMARVDFKSDTNLNSFEAITRALGALDDLDPWKLLGQKYPSEAVALARELSETLCHA